MIVKEPETDIRDMMRQIREGRIKSNKEIKQSIGENRRTIEKKPHNRRDSYICQGS